MAVLKDWRCKFCQTAYEAWSDKSGCGFCGGTGETIYTKLVSHEWSGPRFDRALQRTFSSRSEKFAWLAAHGMEMSPTADKRGGAHLGDTAPPRVSRMYFDPRGPSAKAKGTGRRLDEGH